MCAVLATALLSASAAPATAAAGGGNCRVVLELVNGKWTAITVCTGGNPKPGKPGSGSHPGGSQTTGSCTLSALPRGYPVPYPAPKGDEWMWQVCRWYINGKLVPDTAGIVLVRKNGAGGHPAVSLREVLAMAEAQLQIPALAAATAPPRGKDGLVGLPEWFWIPPRQWRALHSTVSVAGVWATVTATPGRITFSPGAGLTGVTCAGPGTPYNPRLSAAEQSTKCSYTYGQPSTGQPGNAYQASVSVTWDVTWVGSGGAGGHVGTVQQAFPFRVPVAQGEALVTNP
jgi:hypothetical protein